MDTNKMVTLNGNVCAAPSFNDKWIRLNNNPDLKTIDLDDTDMSNTVAVKYETKSVRDSFAWSETLSDPEKYVHKLTNLHYRRRASCPYGKALQPQLHKIR